LSLSKDHYHNTAIKSQSKRHETWARWSGGDVNKSSYKPTIDWFSSDRWSSIPTVIHMIQTLIYQREMHFPHFSFGPHAADCLSLSLSLGFNVSFQPLGHFGDGATFGNLTCCNTGIRSVTQLNIPPSHSILTPGRPVPTLIS